MRGNSFPLNWNHLNQKALVTRHESYATWHKRYGHFNSNALKYLQANEMVRDMPKVECIDDGENGQVSRTAKAEDIGSSNASNEIQSEVEMEADLNDDQIVTESDSPILKIKSLADVYES
ncbi:hypothetical protein JRO89_XS15G0098000 [Xanthoceras sorbifolium]|uniref:GAG-pre-integrase domain-containing protein n=1 Tax=Xanthoceras sorbifolium TaxID=99658 RepID=A0ABQ8H1H2_9ROSI|nr:hypothetical protein JRO89_XS15G0098000 [Xanthoceras sorbifolium]